MYWLYCIALYYLDIPGDVADPRSHPDWTTPLPCPVYDLYVCVALGAAVPSLADVTQTYCSLTKSAFHDKGVVRRCCQKTSHTQARLKQRTQHVVVGLRTATAPGDRVTVENKLYHPSCSLPYVDSKKNAGCRTQRSSLQHSMQTAASGTGTIACV